MKLGNLFATRKVEDLMMENIKFRDDVNYALNRFLYNDWGITRCEDAFANDEAIIYGERIKAEYETCKGRIWILSDGQKSYSTILFPSEY